MKTALIAAVAVLQLTVLAYMAGNREWIVRTGRTVFLRTMPLDPRDPMRGDFVRLDYEISRVPIGLCTPALAISLTGSAGRTEYHRRSTPVCAALRIEDDGIANIVSLSETPPADGAYLRGRVDHQYYRDWYHTVTVKYGIEAWFIEQGTGTNLERRRIQNGIQMPLEMEAAVSPQGRAVLKGYRWARTGIGLDLNSATNAVMSNQWGGRVP